MMRIQTRKQFFGQASAVLGRKRLRLGGQIGNEIWHGALHERGTQFYARDASAVSVRGLR